MVGRAVIIASISMLFSCGAKPNGEVRIAGVDNSAWGRGEPAYVYYDNADTLSLRTITLLIRRTDLFRYDRLLLAVETLSPEGKFFADTVSVAAVGAPGSRRVAGVSYEDTEMVYKTGARFASAGKYRFRFGHAMPDSLLAGITGVGVKIE